MSDRSDLGAMADDRMCFACGPDNPDGLHLTFELDGGSLVTRHSFEPRFQGYRDVVHGGLISTILDETMVTLLNRMGLVAMTAELTVRFVEPVPVGIEIEVTARLKESRRKVHRVVAEATLPGGAVAARAEGRFIAVGALPANQ